MAVVDDLSFHRDLPDHSSNEIAPFSPRIPLPSGKASSKMSGNSDDFDTSGDNTKCPPLQVTVSPNPTQAKLTQKVVDDLLAEDDDEETHDVVLETFLKTSASGGSPSPTTPAPSEATLPAGMVIAPLSMLSLDNTAPSPSRRPISRPQSRSNSRTDLGASDNDLSNSSVADDDKSWNTLSSVHSSATRTRLMNHGAHTDLSNSSSNLDDAKWKSMDSVHSRTSAATAPVKGNTLEEFNDSCDSFASFGSDGDDDEDDDKGLSLQRAAFTKLMDDTDSKPKNKMLMRSQSLSGFRRGGSFRGTGLDLIEETKPTLE